AAVATSLTIQPCHAVQAARSSDSTAGTESADGLSFPADPTEQQAVDLLSDGKNAEAQQLLTQFIKSKKGAAVDTDVYYLLALTEFNDGDYKSTITELQRVLDASQIDPIKDPRHKIWLLKRIGDCYFNLRRMPEALEQYKAALLAAKALSPNDTLTAKLT